MVGKRSEGPLRGWCMRVALACVPLVAACGSGAGAEEGPARTQGGTGVVADSGMAVALSFDDLPGVALPGAGCDPDALRALNERLLSALRRNNAPATGLVTGSRMCGPDAALLGIYRRWLEDGHILGNHTFSHEDLNERSLDWYTADIERNQALLDAARGGAPATRWFRAPFLHYGDSPAKHAGLRAYLDANEYRIARVSIDNQEWVFADVYGRAKARGDTALMRRVGDAYIPFMDSVLAFFEDRTRAVVGRYPPQVLLLHVNDLNADRLDDLVAMIRGRGYRIVPMDSALADPWYAEPDGYVGPRGLAWVHRRVITEGATEWPEEPREPGWLSDLR